jgi:hypothetical protein
MAVRLLMKRERGESESALAILGVYSLGYGKMFREYRRSTGQRIRGTECLQKVGFAALVPL